MKKIILFAASIILLLNAVIAQQRIETFEKNTFSWEEVAEKKANATINNGQLVLHVKKSEHVIKPTARFPLNVRENFKVTYKFTVPKLNDDIIFGVILNGIEEKSVLFGVSENAYFFTGSNNAQKKGEIKLKKGKNVQVVITVEKKGDNLTFSVNNMTAYEVAQELQSPIWGVALQTLITPSATVMVDEIIIDQLETDE